MMEDDDVDEDDERTSSNEYFCVSSRTEYLQNATESLLAYPIGSYHHQDIDSVKRLIMTWPRKSSLEAAIIVEKLLKRLVDEKHAQKQFVLLDSSLYVAAIEAWGRADVPGGAERAQAIHDGLVNQQQHQNNDFSVAPSLASYNALLMAWKDNVTVAEAVFQELQQQKTVLGIQPDLGSYTALLEAYIRCLPSLPNIAAAVARCEDLFDSMAGVVQRDQYCYSLLQNIYAKSGLPDAVLKTTSVLVGLERKAEQGDVFAKPSITIYNGA